MSRRDQLNSIARRQLENLGQASGMRYVAERLDILKAAKAFLDENDFEDYDIMDVLTTAEFLAGDRVEGP